MWKKIALTGTVVLLALALLVSSTAAQDAVDVFPFIDGATWYATENQDIHLIWGWLATTKGLVRVFLNHSMESYLLTDSAGDEVWSLSYEEAEAYFTPPIKLPPEDFGVDCPMPLIAGTIWEYTIDPLPAGTYTLVWTQNIDQPVNDGYHVCTNLATGEPAAQPPSLFQGEYIATSTIVVSPE